MTFLLITIDTEGDNLWRRRKIIETENARFIPRFQQLCDKYEFAPTYLVNYEIACSNEFVNFAKKLIKNKTAELGMHLHAWNSPPEYKLTEDDYYYMPYLIEYPDDIIIKKIEFITKYIEDRFSYKPVTHRAGRWAFNSFYAKVLLKYGYLVDCSVTPNVSWKKNKGNPFGQGGTDYHNYPETAFFINPEKPMESGNSKLLEIPMTIVRNYNSFLWRLYSTPVSSLVKRLFGPPVTWFRPMKNNLESLHRLIRNTLYAEKEYIMMMLHSSELMPGGSPTFKTKEDIENLYMDLNSIFDYLKRKNVKGLTCREYYNLLIRRSQ